MTDRGHKTGKDWMTIGEVATASGLSSRMIRHYESLGLLPAALRSDTGYRYYNDKALHELRFIRHARDLGFGLPQIADLLALWRDQTRSSADVQRLARQQIDELDARIAELQQMKSLLGGLVARCHGDDRPDCPILESLADGESLAGEETKRGCQHAACSGKLES